MCESCLQERDQWLIGKRPHFGPQIFTERGGRKTEPFWGPPRLVQHRTGCPKTTPFFQNRCAPGRRQLGHCRGKKATAAWQWFNWTLQRVPLGKTPLRLNFDETSCRLFYETAPGILGSEPIASSAHKGFITQQVTRRQKRGTLSFLALLCDDPTIQPLLPQIIVGNEHLVPEAVRRALEAESLLMTNVTVLRRKSAWVNDELLSLVAATWGKALRKYKDTHQPILLMDVCSPHLGLRFLRALARWNIWSVFIPGRTTWLLQPCDTHCFAAFKGALRTMFEQCLLESEDGTADIMSVILHLNRAIRRVIQGKEWAPAFDGNGWSSRQQLVRHTILTTLECKTVPEIPNTLPSLRQFQAIFPKRRCIPLGALLNHYRGGAGAAEPIAPTIHSDMDVEPAAIRGPWHGRLRSSSGCNLVSREESRLEHPMHREPSPPPLPPPAWPPSELLPQDRDHQRLPPSQGVLPVGRPLLPRARSRQVLQHSLSSPRLEEARPSKLPKASTP